VNSITVGLIGNPNCGKTTVFNALTGARQKVGNWPGVTVERKSGYFNWQNTQVEIIDLPGTYSLTTVSETTSIDERIVCEYILNHEADVIINVLDASNLERHLYLTLQLIEMRVPLVIALNMMDVARLRQIKISVDQLEQALGCPVIVLEAHKNKGIKELKNCIVNEKMRAADLKIYSDPIIQSITTIAKDITAASPEQTKWMAVRLLEDDVFVQRLVVPELLKKVAIQQDELRRTFSEDPDILLADARYRFIHQLVEQCVATSTAMMQTFTARIDRIVLNRVLGIPIFLTTMYLMFLFAINIGGAFQDFFDIGSNTIFVDGLAQALTSLGLPAWAIALLASGIGKGINTTVTFIPVIGALFLFLAFLEDSGYMARAAFVVDRFMRTLGLPGKSFVPMIVGFGCNVPAVMASRTLENKRDRILTVMMSPFMSCGARLAIYTVFTAAFFPVGGQNIVFALYVIGILMAMLTGLLLRKTLLQGDPAPLTMELPAYHVPTVKTVVLHAWQRLKNFIFRAGKLIIPICILLGALNALNIDGSLSQGDGDMHSLLSTVGRWVTPIFAPMGIHQDNWPATVGLVTGILAKEVVIGTLNTLYTQLGHFAALPANVFDFWGGLHAAIMSIPANFAQLGDALGNPVLAKAPVHTLSQSVYGLMYQRFDGQVGAFAYLLFVLLYFPCISTTAAMVRELNRGWSLFSVFWTTGVAYGTAVGFYQLATWMRHPVSSMIWIMSIAGVLGFVIFCIRFFAMREQKVRRRYEFART
jgi:ferrous iron transport protein B